MAHEIDESTGKAAAYYAGRPAWHGLGVVTKDAKQSSEAIKLAGLDWEVEQYNLLAYKQGVKDSIGKVPTHMANVRSDTKLILGVVTTDYVPLQNRDAFDFLDSLVKDRQMYYESAGALKEGRVVWMLARLDKHKFDGGKNDVQVPYMLISTAHDGSRAIRVVPTFMRVVCWNTLQPVVNASSGFSVRHTGDIKQKLAQAAEVMGYTEAAIEKYKQGVKAMTKVQLPDKQARAFVEDVLPLKNAEGEELDRNRLIGTQVMELYHGDETITGVAGAKGTAWGMVNAFTRFVDWKWPTRGRDERARNESRMNTAMFGPGAQLKTQAWNKGLALVK